LCKFKQPSGILKKTNNKDKTFNLFEGLLYEGLGSQAKSLFKKPTQPNEKHVHSREDVDDHVRVGVGHDQYGIEFDTDHDHLQELYDYLDNDTARFAYAPEKRYLGGGKRAGEHEHEYIEHVIRVNNIHGRRLHTIGRAKGRGRKGTRITRERLLFDVIVLHVKLVLVQLRRIFGGRVLSMAIRLLVLFAFARLLPGLGHAPQAFPYETAQTVVENGTEHPSNRG
jgi:hypothetical protein